MTLMKYGKNVKRGTESRNHCSINTLLPECMLYVYATP